MRLIGLCGKSGSGKGVFCHVAEREGFKVIDCDAVYKDLVSQPSDCLKELEQHFGSEIIQNNSLNRRALAPIVFSDKDKLALLNSITHKHILSEINKILSDCNNENVILDAPTLFESGLNKKCDLIIGIIAADEDCVSRIIQRDSISESDARLRLSNQKNNEFILNNCQIIINNTSNLQSFIKESEKALKAIKEIKHEA